MNTLRRLLLTTLLIAASFAPAQAANLVLMIGEDEYLTWETLPFFAEKELKPLGHHVTIIHADAADKNHFPGLIEALRDADLLLVSVRRRTPRKEELDAVRAFLAAGRPLIGIRTASHAFALRPNDKVTDPKLDHWQDFDPAVLGGNYSNHHRGEDKTIVALAPGAEAHAILKSITITELIGHGTLYKNTPLATDATPLLIGTIPNQPAEPVAWTHRFGPKQAKIFYTSFGHPDDFKDAAFRRLLLNAIAWALAK
ncbi:ThuA domain-containing protein [Prosthecobacter sp.]|uniref:ThuA domain-containing protein n=1 Tax=Prosthecobacter sp. TaxID=1965333 RepID=UPI002ABBE34A|nr:ThuA domain-containing protein [Prosthecobacter sp.]MDZ4401417.1 ThuA domain-containing protein [Prosthecobacter sp.]